MGRLLLTRNVHQSTGLSCAYSVCSSRVGVVTAKDYFNGALHYVTIDGTRRKRKLVGRVMARLVDMRFRHNGARLFLCAGYGSTGFFNSLNFCRVTQVSNRVMFVRGEGAKFSTCLRHLGGRDRRSRIAGQFTASGAPVLSRMSSGTRGGLHVTTLIVGTGPFALKRRCLIRGTTTRDSVLRLFVIDRSRDLIPFSIQGRLILRKATRLGGVVCRRDSPCVVDGTAFPDCFRGSTSTIVRDRTGLSLAVFIEVTRTLKVGYHCMNRRPGDRIAKVCGGVVTGGLPRGGVSYAVIPQGRTGKTMVDTSAMQATLGGSGVRLLGALIPRAALRCFRDGSTSPIVMGVGTTRRIMRRWKTAAVWGVGYMRLLGPCGSPLGGAQRGSGRISLYGRGELCWRVYYGIIDNIRGSEVRSLGGAAIRSFRSM